MKTEDAIAFGIKTTAGVVTSAAIVMVFVFSIFGTLSLIMMKQFGVGLATAVRESARRSSCGNVLRPLRS